MLCTAARRKLLDGDGRFDQAEPAAVIDVDVVGRERHSVMLMSL